MKDVFTITPASVKPLWALAILGGFLVAMILLFAFLAYSSRATRFEISPSGLTIGGTMYGRSLPWSNLDVERARVVDLTEDRDWQPTLRTNGIGLPGYQAGWFRLRNGGKGLLFVTDRTRVVALPTRDDYTLLLSVQRPEMFLESMRRAIARSE